MVMAAELTPSQILSHPEVQRHLNEIASGKRQAWDPIDYAALDVPALIVDPADRQPATNSAKYGVKVQWNACEHIQLDAAIGAPQDTECFVERPGMQGGDIEFLGFVASSTDRFVVMPKSNTLNLELANRPVHSTLIFGKGLAGAPWPASFYEPGMGFILMSCANRVALLNDIDIVGVGRRFIGEEAQQTIEARRAKFLTSRINPFFTTYDASDDGSVEHVLPAGGTLDLQCTIPSVGDVLWTGLRDDSTRAGGGRPKFSISITDGLSGYELMNRPIPIELVAAMSLASVDSRLPAPSFDGSLGGLFTHLQARSTKILVHLESHDNADITVRQAFPGVELRYKPATNRDTNLSAQTRQAIIERGSPIVIGNIVNGGRS